MLRINNIARIKQDVFGKARSDEFAGYDPFDGLNSSFLSPFAFLRKSLFGLVWIQFFKRSPINLRQFFLVPKKRNPKGVGLFILGLIQDYKYSNDSQYLDTAQELADWLLTQQSDRQTWMHSCWGYHFDWNARAFFVPKNKPNVITTIYVSMALYQLGELINHPLYLNSALDSAHFIFKSLVSKDENGDFIAYIPDERAFVHNASLWGAAWLAFVGNKLDIDEYRQVAKRVGMRSVNGQTEDGAWVYGDRHHHQFIDGFHTGYNLEALDLLRKSLNTSDFDAAIKKGLNYYKKELIDKNYLAKYYHNNPYPLDMHSVAQLVLTLIKVGATDKDFQLAYKVIQASIKALYLPNKKQFVYQKTAFSTNKINYARWTQAWAYYSFAYFINASQSVDTDNLIP